MAALVVAAVALGGEGLLVPGDGAVADSSLRRVGGLAIAAFALVQLARHRDVGIRGTPAALAAVTQAAGSQRAGMATVLVFLGVGAGVLATVREA